MRYDVSIILPCLNEAPAVGYCIDEAFRFQREAGLSGEVLLVDNGSSDGSVSVAEAHGAQVLTEPKRGYGHTLRRGLAEAKGEVLLMADCDTTYDFADFARIYSLLAEGEVDLVVGNRFAGSMERGAMPLIHQWGVKALSALGRHRYHATVTDFHCGIRGLRREALSRLTFRTGGMEFATEMIAAASLSGLRIGQTSVSLRRARFRRASKLRTFRDGLRHLRYILEIK